MRERALVHVAGPPQAGKTTLVERLLEASVAFSICVRAHRDATLRKEKESAPKAHPELRRYRAAGASAVALYRFADVNMDAFFTTEFMDDYSEAVFIEGDRPIDHVDLSVFVAPPAAKGHTLLRRVVRDRAAEHQASLEHFALALESPDAMARLLGAGGLDERILSIVLNRPRALDDLRRSLKSKLGAAKRVPAPAPSEHWALDDPYVGIEHAQVVVVNVRSALDRDAAGALLDDIARLRTDDVIFRDVMGVRGNKLPITAAVADLSSSNDAGLKRVASRVKRATSPRSR